MCFKWEPVSHEKLPAAKTVPARTQGLAISIQISVCSVYLTNLRMSGQSVELEIGFLIPFSGWAIGLVYACRDDWTIMPRSWCKLLLVAMGTDHYSNPTCFSVFLHSYRNNTSIIVNSLMIVKNTKLSILSLKNMGMDKRYKDTHMYIHVYIY